MVANPLAFARGALAQAASAATGALFLTLAFVVTTASAQTIPFAHDGRSLAGESPATRASFATVWGERGSAQWIIEHNAELARSRTGRIPRIAYISVTAPAVVPPFLSALRDLGYAPGQSVIAEWRFSEARIESLPNLAAELVNLPVDVLVTNNVIAAVALKNSTTTIPIVLAGVADPIGAGLVSSLERPGGNITGVSATPPGFWAQRLELARQAVPTATRVAFLWNMDNAADPGQVEEIQALAATHGLQVIPVGMRSVADLDAAFATARQEGADVLLQTPGTTGQAGGLARIAALALQHRLPVLSVSSAFATEGGLLTYAAKASETPTRTAGYVDRILNGARPSDLPMSYPTEYDLIINLRTAEAIGLTLPQAILARATEIIR